MAQSKPRWFLVVIGLLAICALCGGLGLPVYQAFDPPHRVRIFVEHIPVGVEFLSLVASADGEIVNLDWSPNSELQMPFTMHPAHCVWSSQDPSNPKVDWHAYVQWRPAQRYGVVTRKTDGAWQVVWFAAEQVPLRGKRLLLGGGRVEFDLAQERAEPLVPDQVQRLGLPTSRRGH